MNLLLTHVKRLLSFTPRLLIKYVDDLAMAVPKDELHNILPAFNSFQDHIQFTMETEMDGRLPYLDLLLINNGENQNIATDFYSKPSSSGRILNFHSCHPRHVVRNTANSFVSRVLALSSEIFHGNKHSRHL